MTVKAYIMTTKVGSENGKVSLQFSNNKNESMVDVWFVTISESLSDKTNDEIVEILDIRDYGVWITSPYENSFWVISFLDSGFSVEEIPTATMDKVYTKFEIDSVLANKADIAHTHVLEDLPDFEVRLNAGLNELADDVNTLMDNLAQAFIHN